MCKSSWSCDICIHMRYVQWNLATTSLSNAAISLKQPMSLERVDQPVHVSHNNLTLRSSHLTNPATFSGPKCGRNSEVPLYIM